MALSFAAIFAAAVFLASGLGKLTARGAVSSFIEQLGIPRSWLPAINTIIPVAEITLGLLLVSGIAIRQVAMVSAVVAAGFLAAHLLSLVRGNTASCRCFGTLDTALRPAVSAIRAGVFLAADDRPRGPGGGLRGGGHPGHGRWRPHGRRQLHPGLPPNQ